MNRITKYLYVGYTAVRSNVAYFGEVAVRVLFLGVVLYIFLQLWRVTYSETGAERLGGFTLAEMLWYLAITESIVLSAPPVTLAIDADVRTGTLAVHLLRPLSYPLYRMWTALGERAVRFAVNLIVASCVALVFVGPIHVSLRGLAIFACAVPLAFVLDFAAYFTIGILAFWLENTTGLTLIYSRVAMIFGGMLLPVELFPETLQRVIGWLPFASIVYGPARMFIHPDPAFLAGLIVRQIVAVSVLALAAASIYAAAVRRIHAHGG